MKKLDYVLPGWRIEVDLESRDVALIGRAIGSSDPYPEELIEWVSKAVKKELSILMLGEAFGEAE